MIADIKSRFGLVLKLLSPCRKLLSRLLFRFLPYSWKLNAAAEWKQLDPAVREDGLWRHAYRCLREGRAEELQAVFSAMRPFLRQDPEARLWILQRMSRAAHDLTSDPHLRRIVNLAIIDALSAAASPSLQSCLLVADSLRELEAAGEVAPQSVLGYWHWSRATIEWHLSAGEDSSLSGPSHRFAALRVLSADALADHSHVVLQAGGTYEARLPWRADDAGIVDQGVHRMHAPALTAMRVGEARVFGSGLVTKEHADGSCLLDFESTIDLCSTWTAGHRHFILGRSDPVTAVVKMPRRWRPRAGGAVLLAGRAPGNYFHWVLEYLPRVLPLLRSGMLDGRELLVRGPLYPQQLASLIALTGEQIVVRQWRDDSGIPVSDLTVVDGHAMVGDNPKIASHELMAANLDLVRMMAAHILEVLDLTTASGNRRVYLKRAGVRDLTNLREVESLLREEGFETVRPESLTFYDQVKIFRESAILAGPSGAAFANMIFTRSNSVGIVLNAARHVRNSLFSQLADTTASKIVQVAGREIDNPRSTYPVPTLEDLVHADYAIPRDRLRTAIAWAKKQSQNDGRR